MKRLIVLVLAGLLLNAVTLTGNASGAEKLDVVFGIDLTGSMGGEISQVKIHSNNIMNEIASLVPDCAFGVTSIVDYPHYYCSYGYCSTYGGSSDYAYMTDLDITTNRTTVSSILNGLTLRWGADGPQDYVRLLYESLFLNWRPDATRILVVFGDAPAHDDDLFSSSYGGDPGRDEVMFTSDDLDYQDVIQQVAEEGIIVVSVDSGGAPSATGYSRDVFTNFEYMASQTGGRHFMLADATQIPAAILELIEGSITEEFIWQQISLDGEIYNVKVKARKKPQDPSTFVYPLYCGSCEAGYRPLSMKIEDELGQTIGDEETIRKIMAYARNAALYRSWADETADPIPILNELGGFSTVFVTPPASYCFGLVDLGGGTDTSFGYSYPGYLTFPDEYTIDNGIPRLVDWDFGWDDTLATFLCDPFTGLWDYIHPLGMATYNQRKEVYVKLLHHFVMQDGVYMLEKESAANMLSLLDQTEQALTTLGYIEDAKRINDIVVTIASKPGAIQIAFREAMRELSAHGLHFSHGSMANISKALKVQNHYTGWATKAAPVIGFFLEAGLTKWQWDLELEQDQFMAIIQSMAMYDHGVSILDALKIQLFETGLGMDFALFDAFTTLEAEFSLEAGESFYQKFFEDLRMAREAGKIIDSAQLALSAGIAIAAVVPGGQPVAVALTCVHLGISLVRAGWDFIVAKLEYETLQQSVVACATLESMWWERPLYNHALAQLLVSGAVWSADIDHVNWLISTKLFQGIFVADKVLEENSDFVSNIRVLLGDGTLQMRRDELEASRGKLVDIFFGRGDTKESLGRLAGRPSAEGEYIGFVPKKELDFLVDLTGPSSALAGHSMRCLLHSPGEIGIVDPAGRRIGTFVRDAGGGNFVAEDLNQIPGATYSGSGADPREITIPEPIPGGYEIYLFGTGSGPYILQLQALSGNTVISQSEVYGTFVPNRAEDGVIEVEASLTGFSVMITSAPTPRSIIAGTVTDSLAGLPISGTRVTAGSLSCITHNDGTFEIANAVPGNVLIGATARGYGSYISDELQLLQGSTLNHDIVLTPFDTTPPSIDAGEDMTMECEGDTTVVQLPDPIVSDDTDPNPVVTNDAPASFPFGCTTVTFTATDASGNSASDSIEVCVVDTTLPTLTPPPGLTVECAGPEGQAIDVGQATALDSCCDVSVASDAPTLFYLGQTTVTWTATDCNGNSSLAAQIVTVQDTMSPEISMSCSPDILWPPNHKMMEVVPSMTVNDICCASNVTVELLSVQMNEGEAENTFDLTYDIDPENGFMGDDIQIIDGRIYLRAERSGKSIEGRIYTITYEAEDCAGNTSTASATVTVPHDMGE